MAGELITARDLAGMIPVTARRSLLVASTLLLGACVRSPSGGSRVDVLSGIDVLLPWTRSFVPWSAR